MLTFLTVCVATEAVAIVILWAAMRRQIRITAALTDLAHKTLDVTEALGGVDQSIISAICPAKSRDELEKLN